MRPVGDTVNRAGPQEQYVWRTHNGHFITGLWNQWVLCECINNPQHMNLTGCCKFHPVVHVKGIRLRLWTAVTNGPSVHPAGDKWIEHRWNGTDRENRRTRTKTCPSAILTAAWTKWAWTWVSAVRSWRLTAKFHSITFRQDRYEGS
jgi:hypothetical protein